MPPPDLSLPDVTEKSPLPAIIVTPSSPSHHALDYFIAFLAPPPPPTMRERFAAKWKSFRCEGEVRRDHVYASFPNLQANEYP